MTVLAGLVLVAAANPNIIGQKQRAGLRGDSMKPLKYRRMHAIALLAVALCLGGSASVAEDPAEPAAGSALTNANVIMMHDQGLGDQTIIAKIRSMECSFDVSLEGIRAIHEAGLSDDILAEMIRVMTPVAESDEGELDDPGDPNDPDSDHPSGIYFYDSEQSPPRMIKLEPSVYSATKTGGIFKSAITYGAAKVKTRAVLRGAHSQIQITDRDPEFYFYFSQTNQDLNSSGQPFFFGASSANEFALVLMEPGKKKKDKNTRQLLIGKFSAWGGEGGLLDESVVPFKFEKVRDGLYKVTPEQSLKVGEYCFLYAAGVPAGYGPTGPIGGGRVYDFGVTVAEAE